MATGGIADTNLDPNVEIDREESRDVRRTQRERTLTEKGEEYRQGMLQEKSKFEFYSYSKTKQKLADLLESHASQDEIEFHKRRLEFSFDSYQSAHKEHVASLKEKPDLDEVTGFFNDACISYSEIQTMASDRIKELIKDREDAVSIHSSASRLSQRSRMSSASVTLKRAEAAAKTAALEAELSYADAEAKLESETHQLQVNAKKLALQKELAKSKAEQQVFEMFDDLDGDPMRRDVTETTGYRVGQVPCQASPFVNLPTTDLSTEAPQVNTVHNGADVPLPLPAPMLTMSPDPAANQRMSSPQSPSPQNCPSGNGSREPDLKKLVQTVVDLQQRASLPDIQLEHFEGDLLKFPLWLRDFEDLIERHVQESSGRLRFLTKYTIGRARKAIEGFIGLTDDDAYDEAKGALIEWFGGPTTITRAYKEKLSNWPYMPSNDGGEGLRNFSHFLTSCKFLVKKSEFVTSLDDDDLIQKLASKLQKGARDRWSVKAISHLEKNSVFPPFADFCDYVKVEAKNATTPVYGTSVMDKLVYENKKSRNVPTQRRNLKEVHSYATSASDEPGTNKTATFSRSTAASMPSATSRSRCICCNELHDLDDCKLFLKKPYAERIDLVKSNGVCFGCLKRGHRSRGCVERKTCKVCHRRHPTALHSDEPVQKSRNNGRRRADSSTQTCGKGEKNVVCNISKTKRVARTTRIIPVWIYHVDNPNRKMRVYAILDEQSDTTFITDEVRADLDLKGFDVKLNLSTIASSTVVDSFKIFGLHVQGYNDAVVKLPPCYSRESIPVNPDQIVTKKSIDSHPTFLEIAEEIPDYEPNVKVGILIGVDCMRALSPLEIKRESDSGSYAIKTVLGWGIVGMTEESQGQSEDVVTCNKIKSQELHGSQVISHEFVPVNQTTELIDPTMVLRSFSQDFSEYHSVSKSLNSHLSNKPISIDDRQFLEETKNSIHMTSDGHYELPLPFRNKDVKLPNNRQVALKCLQGIKRRFKKEERFKELYVDFMQDAIVKGYAEKVPQGDKGEPGHIWYIPHHGVFHPCKPNKIRVVLNCSSEYQNESLNRHLLQGPDLTNSLIGVLTRFRQGRYAVMCDIEKMFFQVRVNPEHRNFLRFLWWDNGNVTQPPSEYRMTVHPFGAGSSPACCNLALKTTADDNEAELGSEAAEFLRNGFYVDDGLKSKDNVQEMIKLIQASRDMCLRGGFNLTKFISNNKEVIESVEEKHRSIKFKNLDLGSEPFPIERALGVQWCIEDDSFTFMIVLKDRPFTRRGILASVCSILDPFGYIAPVVLEGKRILQELCRDRHHWDDPVPDTLRQRYERWRNSLPQLAELKIKRCFKPDTFGAVKKAELHHFSDGSSTAYGQCSYLRLIDDQERIHCSLVMGKSRVAPLKPVTIPRLELTAALVSVRVGVILKEELEYDNISETYWTDSKVVLGYVSNDSRRFHVYVANRMQEIRDRSEPNQWFYVDTKVNPADDASRGLKPRDLIKPDNRYLNGPSFLWKPLLLETQSPEKFRKVDEADPEVRNSVTFSTKSKEQIFPSMHERIQQFSSFYKAQRFIANLVRLKNLLKSKKQNFLKSSDPISVAEMENAKNIIVMLAQGDAFQEEIHLLKGSRTTDDSGKNKGRTGKQILKKSSTIYRLDPLVDADGLLRVGGRLSQSSLSKELKYPMILPKNHHVTKLVIRHYHEKVHHQGRGITHNELLSSGFWIIGGVSAIGSYIYNCMKCRRLRGIAQSQKMADLPVDRVEASEPFMYCATDLFGPFIIKEGRRELKRYGVLFTCLACRAVRIEVAPSLETDSFINALRRFICRNGPVRQMRCDRGTNFVGAARELREAYETMNQEKIREMLLKENCDYFPFKFNVGSASYQGGSWERQIRSVRAVLSALLEKNGHQLDDDSLRTFLAESEAVVNGRPLTVENLSSHDSPLPLTPNHLLTSKTRLVLPPPGVFGRPDVYSRKRWRRVQHLANEFWQRWRKEFLQSLQTRSKWNKVRRDLSVGDIVIIIDENSPRNLWKLARVVETYPDNDDHVRKVRVQVGDPTLDKKGCRTKDLLFLDRPIQKLILFLENQDSLGKTPTRSHDPDEEP